ncbi:hypothetical protein UFOVP779_8 [uncultured Caudovirales phage]|uniref:Uncharacterized protein n=1 Tax=uncultured Caudovirales phage TaxID=2100421 RepID=A0A6J5NSM2_9CAUD|nr:hypothetical protein UFOVP779_8 [uncultured Caudovirales phage]
MPGLHLVVSEQLLGNLPESPGKPIEAPALSFLLEWGQIKPGDRLAGIELGIVLGHKLGQPGLHSLKEGQLHLGIGQLSLVLSREISKASTLSKPSLVH